MRVGGVYLESSHRHLSDLDLFRVRDALDESGGYQAVQCIGYVLELHPSIILNLRAEHRFSKTDRANYGRFPASELDHPHRRKISSFHTGMSGGAFGLCEFVSEA